MGHARVFDLEKDFAQIAEDYYANGLYTKSEAINEIAYRILASIETTEADAIAQAMTILAFDEEFYGDDPMGLKY